MDKNLTEFNDQNKHYITRRQAIKLGGIVAAGLIFSKPIIDTIRPTPLFAQYGENGNGDVFSACTPGRWKNKFGDWPVDVLFFPNQILPESTTATTLGDAFMFDPPLPAVKLTNLTALEFEGEFLVDALSFQGGDTLHEKMEILFRIGSAALLNSVAFVSPLPPYELSPDEVKDAVKAALNTGDPVVILALKNDLDTINNDPLNLCRFNIDGD